MENQRYRSDLDIVCELEDGRHEMTIWDSKVSEFSTGLELTKVYECVTVSYAMIGVADRIIVSVRRFRT